jgi:hypothetical protein
VIVDETLLGEEPVEPFDWEDYLYETWLEEKRDQKTKRLADASL